MVLVVGFAAICFLAAILPPPGEPRLHYLVTIPKGMSPTITFWDIGAREGTRYDRRKYYSDLHGDGWEDYLYEFAHPRAGPGLNLPGVFSTDLDIPFPCECRFDTESRRDGYEDCRRAVNALIARYGEDRVRQALQHAPSRSAGRHPWLEGIRVTRKPGEPLQP
jgi:hypothetical protein